MYINLNTDYLLICCLKNTLATFQFQSNKTYDFENLYIHNTKILLNGSTPLVLRPVTIKPRIPLSLIHSMKSIWFISTMYSLLIEIRTWTEPHGCCIFTHTFNMFRFPLLRALIKNYYEDEYPEQMRGRYIMLLKPQLMH